MTATPLFFLLPLIVLACASTPSGPTAHNALRAGFTQGDRDVWFEQRVRLLTADDGWLTLVGLDFLTDGVFTIGSDPACTLRYAHASAGCIGAFTVQEDSISFRARVPDVTLDGVPCADRECALVVDDRGTPSVLRNGPLMITAVRRNGALALRVRDNASAIRSQFDGLKLFAFDPNLVVEGLVVEGLVVEGTVVEGSVVEGTVLRSTVADALAAETTVAITNVMGFVETQPIAARLRLQVHGIECELVATPGANGRLFVVFGDTTNGTETYGGGRFLDIEKPVGGRTTIDFNRATNPPCAFTAFATCPTPPAMNRLPLAIRAGERAAASHKAD